MQLDYELQLDVSRRNFAEIESRQYDDLSRRIKIQIVRDGTPITIPQGTVIRCEVKKPDGTYVKENCSTVTESGSTYIVLVLTQNMLAAFGQELIDIVLTHNGQVLGTMSFINRIRKAAVQDSDIMSTSEARELEEAMEEAERIRTDTIEASNSAKESERISTRSATEATEANTLAQAARTGAVNANEAAQQAKDSAIAARDKAEDYANQTAEHVNTGNMTAYIGLDGLLHFAAVIETV